ncbi:MAG TPA: SGNH/GDSL hydrolase family protein [Chitinophagaceae bacterium]|nr:SGNH/GDSL hydrolase family protein [Chitinophagaceae bacterium]
MRDRIIFYSTSNLMAFAGLLLIFVFISAMRSNPVQQTYTLLSLGDSYTIGEKVLPGENFPNQAAALLRDSRLDFRKPRIVAKTGWTTDELLAAVEKARLRRQYDFVTLLIGVNNQYRGRPVENYIPELETLIRKALHFSGNRPEHVIMLSIPDWSVTPFAAVRNRELMKKEVAEYNAAGKLLAAKYGIHYIDITPGTQKAANDLSLLAEDGLHPSAKEYAVWAAEVAAIIKKKISE